jgi:hypothetical protein
MYNADQILIDRLYNNIQTPENNNDPRPLAYITRNRTAISSQRFWEKQSIISSVGSRASIAVRRPKGSFLADMIFTAQVIDGDAVIRYAVPRGNLEDMRWSVLTTIDNISELSIMFDGFMEINSERVEAFTKDDLPYVFFVDTSGSLKLKNLNSNSTDITISDDAVNVASVRGLYSESVDDGIWVFYTNSAGELWEARIFEGEVAELTEITMKPSGVTGWQDCWAGLTFDYRVVLQLKGDDGKVYTLLSASRPSGYPGTEYVFYRVKMPGKFFATCGYPPPTVTVGYNINDNPGSVYLEFDSEVFVYSTRFNRVWIQGGDGTKRYPTSIIKVSQNKIKMVFGSDFIGLPGPHYIDYNPSVGGCFGSQDMQSDLGFEIFLIGVDKRYQSVDYPLSVSQSFAATLEKAFDGKMYGVENVGYLVTLTQNFGGSLIEITRVNGYETEYVTYAVNVGQTIAATVTDTSGTPI